MNNQFDINELNKKYLELETLLDITNELNSYENIATLLQEILIKSCAVLNASSGIILIKDYNSDLFQIEAEFNIDVAVLKGIIFKKNKGFFNELNKNRKSLLVEIASDPFLIKTNCTYGLITPLVDKKDLLGVLILFDKESRSGVSVFDDSDANMLSAIAIQAAVAYNNIKLLENIKEAKTFNDNVMESIVTGVFTTNLMGEINHINKAASKIINLEREQVIGNHYEYVFESNDVIHELLAKCEEEVRTISSTDVQLICNGKNTAVNISVSPLLNDLNESIGSVVAMEDLSNLDKLKSTFKKYVSKQIVDKLLENEDLLNLGGQELTVTTLFSDIRGFTRMSENMQPIDVVKTLNAYFDLMIEVVFKYNGTLDKIIGDELMVIYGAPIYGYDDTKRALFTALEMQKLLEDFNANRREMGAIPIEIGIGINRGKTIAGNIGSKDQMNYTVIGDAVNLASRLCSNAKSGQILVSEAVYLEVVNYGIFDFQRLDSIMVKGKENEVSIFSLIKCNCSPRVIATFDIVLELLLKLAPELYYHSISHTLDVFRTSRNIALSEGVSDSDLELIQVAALFHDTGFLEKSIGHEEISCKLAQNSLGHLGFDKKQISSVCDMILATKIPQQPTDLLGQILADADLDYLGRADFPVIADLLFKELSHQNNLLLESDWDQIQIKFIRNHHYFTKTSIELRTEQKKNHLQALIEKYS